MKDCWDLLNIPPSSDKETIKKAYARLAKFYHPEEHPREFMMLQKAYKEALKRVPEKQYMPNVEMYEDTSEQSPKTFVQVDIGDAEQPKETFEPIDIGDAEQPEQIFAPIDMEELEGKGKSLFKEENVSEYRLEEDPFYLEKRKEMVSRLHQAVVGKHSIDKVEELLNDLHFRAMLQDKEFHQAADTVLAAYNFRCRTKRVKGILLQAKRLGLYSFALSIQRCLKIRRAIPTVIILVLWFVFMTGVFLSRDPKAQNQKEYERLQEESKLREKMEEIIEEEVEQAPAGSMMSAEWMQIFMTGELVLEGEEGNQTLKSGYAAETGEAGTVYAEGIREIRYTFTEVLVLKMDDGWKIFDSRNKQMYDTDYTDILIVRIEESAVQEPEKAGDVVRRLAVTQDNEQWYLADLLGNIEMEISGVPQGIDNVVNVHDNVVRVIDGTAMFSEKK